MSLTSPVVPEPRPAQRKGTAVLKLLRQLHLYIGVFVAPALLFFAFTGALQTFSLHEASRTGNYKPPRWLTVLAQIHKNQTPFVPPPRVQPAAGASASAGPRAGGERPVTPAPAPAPGPQRPSSPQPSRMPLKYFFALVSWSFLISVLSGVYMAYRFQRGAWLITGLLVAGVIVPLGLMLL